MPKVYVDTGETVEKKKYESLYVESIFVQVYIDVAKLFMQIHSPTAYRLLFWIMVHMGKHNEIILNKGARSEFNGYCVAKGSRRVADRTIKGAIRELVGTDLLCSTSDPTKRESAYMLNPSHFWSTGSQKDRVESIKAYIHFKEQQNEEN
jgi:hypothetical protein